MTAYRTRGSTMAGQKMPSHSTLICDADGCRAHHDGDTAATLRKNMRELGWIRAYGKDYCPAHVPAPRTPCSDHDAYRDDCSACTWANFQKGQR